MKDTEYNEEYEDLRKRRYLRIGVISFTIVIAAFWIISVRYSFINSPETSAQEPLINESLKADFQNIIKLDLDVPGSKKNDESQLATEEKSFLEEMTNNLDPKVNDRVDQKLKDQKSQQEMIVNLNNSLIEKNKKNCPEYINCMPQVGAMVNCTIPLGCEDITQIAY